VGDIGAPELIIIGIVIVLLFGATRLPATAKGLGQALRLFKKEIRADDEPAKPAAVEQPAPQLTATQYSGAVTTTDGTSAAPVQAAAPIPVVADADPHGVASH
jgi:sec-independent protein translocase protein TatA